MSLRTAPPTTARSDQPSRRLTPAPSRIDVELVVVAIVAGAGLLLAAFLSTRTSAGYPGRAAVLGAVGVGCLAAGGAYATSRPGGIRWCEVVDTLRYPRWPLVFVLGWSLSLPLLGLHTSLISADSDSARLVASIFHVQRHGLGYLIDSQEVFLPHLVLGPLLNLGGIPAAKWMSILQVQFLAGIVALVAWRVSSSLWGSVASVLALLSFASIVERAYYLPMYAAMLGFGLLAGYLVVGASGREDARTRTFYCLGAAVCLWASVESHEVGQLFLVLTLFLLAARSVRRSWKVLVLTYLFLGLLFIPRLLVNISDGGFSHLITNRVDYWVTEGYLVEIQQDFWSIRRRVDLGTYLRRIPGGVLDVAGITGLPVLAIALSGAFLIPRRSRRFALLATAFVVVVAIQRRLPFYPRYFSQLVAGAAIVAGVTVAVLLTGRRGVPRVLGRGTMTLLAGTMLLTLLMGTWEADRLETRVEEGPYPTLASILPSGARVIGARATYLNFSRADVETYGEQFLTESEYATFLGWESEDAVIDILSKREIEWVLVPARPWRWVRRYHTIWLVPNHGMAPRYPWEVARSSSFCRVAEHEGARLYRLDLAGEGVRLGRSRVCPPTLT